jgi:nitrite reductase/ring-hydroxylating ferredoxin subunit
VHALANVTAASFQATSWVQRRRGRRLAGAALSAVGLGVTVCAGYLGGHLSLVRGVGVNHTAFEEAVTEWTDVAAQSSLTDRTPVRVMANDVPVVLVQLDGTVHALSATCVHAGGPLDEGTMVHGDCLRCPWHGSEFRLADGQVERGPAAVDQPSWEVKVAAGRVHVRSGSTV